MATTTEAVRIPRDATLVDAVKLNEARHEAADIAKRAAAGYIVSVILQSLAQRNRNRVNDVKLSEHMKDKSVDQVITSPTVIAGIGELLADFSEDERSEIRALVFADLQYDHPTSGYSIRWSRDFGDKYFKVSRPL